MKLNEFLETKTLDDVLGPAPNPLIFIDSAATIIDVYRVMEDKKVNGLAIRHTSSHNFVGWVTKYDLLKYAIQNEAFASGYESTSKFLNTTVDELLASSALHNPSQIFDSSCNLKSILSNFIDLRATKLLVRRGNAFFAFTEIDFLAFLYTNMDSLPEFLDQNVHSLFKFMKEEKKSSFETINASQSAFLGFEKMIAHNRRGLGIVDDYHGLVGHLSYSDFIGSEISINQVHQNVLHYRESMHHENPIPLKNTWTIHSQSTLGSALGKMLFYLVHQLWWLEEDSMKPLIMISADDIIHFIHKQLQK